MAGSRQSLLPQARALYAAGSTIDEVAEALGVSPGTLYRWKRGDAETSADWDARRETRRRKDPHALITLLETRLIQVAESQDMEPGAWADVLQKVSNVLEKVRARVGDLSTTLGTLHEFALWAAEQATDEDLAVLRRLIEAYLSHLKRSHLP